jgi:hypothetical protein
MDSMKRMVCSMVLAAGVLFLVQSALAQNYTGTPKAAISDYGPFPTNHARNSVTKPAAGECGNPAGHCLFYGGDFLDDPTGPNLANGLANETDNLINASPYGAATWAPFTVPAGQTWEVTGLFSNDFSSYGVLDQSPNQPVSAAYWSINQGVVAGNGGTSVASGTSAATITPTGRSSFELNEYTVQVKGIGVTLTAGTYWMIVVPLCTNTANVYCDGVFFQSDADYVNTTPANAVGVEPEDASYFDSPYFGESFDPTNGPLGACGGIGCDKFSVGVLGSRAGLTH